MWDSVDCHIEMSWQDAKQMTREREIHWHVKTKSDRILMYSINCKFASILYGKREAIVI
jgi:hypothetical protein